ncbi:amidohydrolase [Clostridium cavendishii DSM 21758]|uniref:Amidohydrolase n=1 Tax=Clostridium cavendishii DSM 21758 TaxID=1121302 RepID=A0A1M6UQT2_9CLOT|nr:amidohydrolase [Clostridium cavendishii]SHK71531.1 amidohydrolase [Clostridium cavendishii DSM 21758]
MVVNNIDKKYEEYIIKVRRYLHQNPELSWKEYNTSRMIEKELKDIGIKTERIGNVGVVGIIETGNDGNVVGLRADMDALPIEEKTDVEYKSKNKFMHACGHDCHMAMLLGASKYIFDIRHSLKGKIKLVFQPAEETGLGAKIIIDSGFLDDVKYMFGMHIWGELESGKFSFEKGAVMASADTITIKIDGNASHGASPENGIDAIVTAAAIILNIQSIVSRNIAPVEPAVITLGTINGGDRENIIPKYVEIKGTVRTFSNEVRKNVEDRLRNVIENTARTYGAKASLEYVYCPPPLINDNELVDLVNNIVTDIFGKEELTTMGKIMASEDFAFYAENIRSIYGFLGCGSKNIGKYPNHSDKFVVDEKVLNMGANLYVEFVKKILKSNLQIIH